MEIIDIIVDHSQWCSTCKYGPLREACDPCNDCLAEAVNQQSEKPVKYEPAE